MSHKLAIFDIDGTIAVKGKIPESVIVGLKHIQSLGYLTTVSTGRAYRRLKEALGENFNTVISPDALIIAEHGTKILGRDGHIVQADYFGAPEIEHLVDFLHVNAPMMEHLAYATPDPEAPYQIWVREGEDIETIRKKRGYYADVFQCSWEELKERMHSHEISHVLVKLQDFITVENLKLHFTRSNLDLIFMDSHMQFVGNLSDKAKTVLFLEKLHGIHVENMLIAGNGINDVDMLNLKAGKRVLVGTDEQAANVIGHLNEPKGVTRIETPEKLGEYLQGILN